MNDTAKDYENKEKARDVKSSFDECPKCNVGNLVYYDWIGKNNEGKYRACDELDCEFDEKI
ncbi:hypothetical protein HOE31_00940 [bacterium]|nr:hypothetical protein [bacterium]MBT4121501.1 hypothetical protein [bacterium]MBT4335418.1 hypothetical protein [bacterium]MBT4495898.1 hypothetical protein [bacterium]MBT4764066.1 hypothetical protein [bacterium]